MATMLANGIQQNCVDRGTGPVLLLVHGFPLDATMWIAQVDALASNFRVLAPDLRGFGTSEVVAGTSTMELFADDLAALLDAYEIREPVTFCGLSMGGYVGWQFARKYRPRLKSLIACDTRAIADTPEAVAGRMKMIDQVHTQGPSAAADAMLPKLLSPTTVKDQPELVEATRQMILRSSVEGIVAALRGLAARPDVTDFLPTIDVPTLVICGQDDAICSPAEMRGFAATIPNSQFEVIPDAGHMAPMENPAAVTSLIRKFL